MLKTLFWRSGCLAVITVLLSTAAMAQGLSTLPDADVLIYLNPQRILNDAAPKVMPEADVTKMRQQFDSLKQMVGVDPSKLDYIVIGLRFRKPAADLSFQMPEFMVVTSGDFNADALVTGARGVIGDKAIDEKYGSKTLVEFTIDDLAKEAEKTPFLKPFSKLALVSLNGNTLAAGNIGFLKAAVDASEGRERINADTLNSLMRDPNALISLAGSPWGSFAKSFGLGGTEANPRTPRCETRLGDFYAAVTQEGTNFRIRGAMNADNPDTAKIIGGLVAMLIKTVPPADSNPQSLPSMLKLININATETEVLMHADIPQQVVADFIREQSKPKVADQAVSAPASATAPTPATTPKPPVKKRRAPRKRSN
jgi:hypothetical protein